MATIAVETRAGFSLVADIVGSPTDPAVVLFPGGGQTRHAWGGAAAAIAERSGCAVSFDLPGHGDSGRPQDGQYDLQLCAECVADAANAFDRPVLVGASFGGMCALVAVGERLVDKPRALVLADVTPHLERGGVERVTAFMELGADGFDSLDDVARAIASFRPDRQTPTTSEGLRKNVRRADDGRWYWHWDPAFLSSLGRQRDHPERMRSAARALDVPTLLVRGASSDVVSDEGVAEFRELTPHLEVVDLAGAGHMVVGGRNDRFIAAALDFLEAL